LRKERLEQEGEVESTPKFISRSAPALCKGWNIEIYSLFLKKNCPATPYSTVVLQSRESV
jgi:hypothetical protein